MTSLCKTAKAIDSVFRILRVLAGIACIVSLVFTLLIGAALAFQWDPGVLVEADQIISLGSVQLTIAPEYVFSMDSILYYGLVNMAMILVLSFAALVSIKYIRSILLPMTEGEPFRDIVSSNLKKLALVTIIFGLVKFFLTGLETYLVGHFYGEALGEIIEGSLITNIAYEAEGDLTFLLVAGVLFLLSYVFRYAQELQKLSDETL